MDAAVEESEPGVSSNQAKLTDEASSGVISLECVISTMPIGEPVKAMPLVNAGRRNG